MESGCDAWIIDVTPYLTNQMVHIPVEMGGQDVTTTIPHPSIPDFDIFYNIDLEGCDTAFDDMLVSFNDDCFACKVAYDNCCY